MNETIPNTLELVQQVLKSQDVCRAISDASVGFFILTPEYVCIYANKPCELETSVRENEVVDELPPGYIERIVRDRNGEPIGSVGISHENSFSKERLANLQLAQESRPDALWSLDSVSGALNICESAAEFLKCHVNELPSTLDDLIANVHEGDRDSVSNAIQNCLTGKCKRIQIDFRYLHGSSDHLFLWVSLSGAAEVGRLGRGSRMAGFMSELASSHLHQSLIRTGLDSLKEIFVFTKDDQLRFTYVNQALADAFGKPKELILGKTDADLCSDPGEVRLFNEADREVILGASRDLLRGFCSNKAKPKICKERFTDWRGNSHSLETTKIPLYLPDGSVQLLGISRNLEHIREVRKKYQERHHLLVQMLDAIQDAIYAKDISGQFVFGNQALLKLAGLTDLEQLVGRKAGELFPVASADSWNLDDQIVTQTGQAHTTICQVPDSQNLKQMRLVSKYPMVDQNGSPSGVIAVSRDLTKAMIGGHDRSLQAALDIVDHCVFVKDTLGRYVACNRSFADRHGKPPAEIVGITDFQICVKELARKYVRDDNQVMTTKRARLNYRECQIDMEGNVSTLLTSKVPIIDDDGSVAGILGLYTVLPKNKSVAETARLENSLNEAVVAIRDNPCLNPTMPELRLRPSNEIESLRSSIENLPKRMVEGGRLPSGLTPDGDTGDMPPNAVTNLYHGKGTSARISRPRWSYSKHNWRGDSDSESEPGIFTRPWTFFLM